MFHSISNTNPTAASFLLESADLEDTAHAPYRMHGAICLYALFEKKFGLCSQVLQLNSPYMYLNDCLMATLGVPTTHKRNNLRR